MIGEIPIANHLGKTKPVKKMLSFCLYGRNMRNTTYSYEQPGRNIVTVLLLIPGFAMAGLGLYHGAPWPWWVPIGFYNIGLLWMVICNPLSGVKITSRYMTIYSGRYNRELLLRDIDRVEITTWSEGGDTGAVYVRSGERIHIPSICLGNSTAFRDALDAHGIAYDKD